MPLTNEEYKDFRPTHKENKAYKKDMGKNVGMNIRKDMKNGGNRQETLKRMGYKNGAANKALDNKK